MCKERLTSTAWKNFDPWECCGQDKYCKRGCHDEGGCAKGCIVPKIYAKLAKLEDTAIANTDTASEDVDATIKWLETKGWEIMPMDKRRLAIRALQQYRKEPCEWCDNLANGQWTLKDDDDVIHVASFCPNCGRDLRGDAT